MSLQNPVKSLRYLPLVIPLLVCRADAQTTTNNPASPECVPVPEGIVGWWAGDRGAKDRLQRSHGEASDGMNYKVGKVGRAFSFEIADAAVKIPPLPNLEIGSGLTIHTWVRPSTTAIYPLVEWNNGAGNSGAHLWIFDTPGRIFLNLIGPQKEHHIIASGPGIIKKDVFQHIAATYDMESGIARLYRNGVLMAEDYLGTFRPQTTYDLYLGFRPGNSHYFRGELDEVCVFNRALNSSEIQASYEAGRAGYCFPTNE